MRRSLPGAGLLLTPLVVVAAGKTAAEPQQATIAVEVYGSFTELDEQPSGFVIKRLPGDDATRDLRLEISFEGDSTPGVDYVIPAVPRLLPAGHREVAIPITIIDDEEAEGEETILISVVAVPKEPSAAASPASTTRPTTRPAAPYEP